MIRNLWNFDFHANNSFADMCLVYQCWITCHDPSNVLHLYRVVQNNLTLFKSHISHKWESIMNLFEYIYKIFGRMLRKWHQNLCWNNEMGALFWQMVKNHFTHTQRLRSLVGSTLLYRWITMHTAKSINQSVSAWCIVHSVDLEVWIKNINSYT